MKVLELYSGIGGMHSSLRESGIEYEVVGSFEISPLCLRVYNYNFSENYTKTRNIMSFSVEELEKLAPDILMLSPPCQPFTRQGLKKDIFDARVDSFLHLISILQNGTKLPKFILLENVCGFEHSEARNLFISILNKHSYYWQEFLLSPLQFGIPNSRLRYYLLAKKSEEFAFSRTEKVSSVFPACLCLNPVKVVDIKRMLCKICNRVFMGSIHEVNCRYFAQYLSEDEVNNRELCPALPLSYYLEKTINFDKYKVNKNLLGKFADIMDIVDSNSVISCCFTKSYSHYIEGTGSVVKCSDASNIEDVFLKIKKLEKNDCQRIEVLSKLKLRFFSPHEILKLMGFPQWYKLPVDITDRQKYKLLGNSINVLVVTVLLLSLVEPNKLESFCFFITWFFFSPSRGSAFGY